MGENGTQAKSKFSLAMIVRDCAKELERCLKSFAAYPDEIVVVNTGLHPNEKGFQETNAVAESFGAKVFHFPWIEDFSAARNFSFSKCSNDIVMWLDSDDTVEHPKQFADAIRGAFGSEQLEVMYAEYMYDFDERGNCTALLTRERVVNRKFYEWRAPIHEVLCENYHCRGAKLPANVGRIIHHRLRGEEVLRGSLERNKRVLEHHYLPKEQGGLGEYCEERMVFYWANTLVGLGRHEEALRKYLEYIPRSGSNAEIQHAFSSASECARFLGKMKEAKALAIQAIERNPEAPTPYWMAAQAHYRDGNMQLAAHYALGCLERANKFQQEMVANPKVIFGGSAMLLASIYCNLAKLDEALPMLDIAVKYYGANDPEIVEMRKGIAERKKEAVLTGAYLTLKNEIDATGTIDDLRALAKGAPKQLRGLPEVARHLFKPRPTDKKTIAFLCGGGMVGGWGPELLESGIGGSEEAVCYLAEQFVKKGWHVEVYASCTRQTWRGVEWYPIAEFSGDDDPQPLDVLVVWRNAWQAIDFGARAKRTYVWLHDMPDRSCWMADLWNAFDGIFVLSEFHKKVYDFIPDDKKIVSANGIALDDLVPLDQLQNDPKRFIYSSDPIRGLETVLDWWPMIRKSVADAELDIFYGFSSTLLAHSESPTPYGRHLKEIIRRITEKRDQPGVNWIGKVGQKELHTAMSKAGTWLYPTCVTGDTLIDMPRDYTKYPRGVPISELEGKSGQLVWTIDEKTGHFQLKPMLKCWKAKENAEIVRVIWDDGTSLYCTPEHRVMTYKRGWVEAKDLQQGESAVALKKHAQVEVSVGQGPWQKEHRLIAEAVFGKIPKGYHVDHIDGNCFNNSPDNFQIMSPAEHARKTFTGVPRLKQAEKRRAAAFKKWAKTPEGQESCRRRASNLGDVWGKMSEDERAKFIASRAEKIRAGHRRNKQKEMLWNHKVVRVESAGVADVYDMAVDGNHNFVAGGVVVHNCFPEISCITAMKQQAHGAVPITVNDFALAETVKHGVKIDGKMDDPETQKKWFDAIVDLAVNPFTKEQRLDMATATRAAHGWDKVADQWVGVFEASLAEPRIGRVFTRNRLDVVRQ